MKAINTAELKNHLSRYLRAVRRGERFIVLDRKDPIAELGPVPQGEGSPWERLARQGRLVLGSQRWKNLKITRLEREVPIQQLLREVRED